MEKDLMIRGYYRLNKLLMEMMGCVEKQEIIRLSTNFLNDAGDFIAMLYVENDIEPKDVDQFNAEIDNIENEATELNDVGNVIPEGASTSVGEEKPPVDLVPHSPSDDL